MDFNPDDRKVSDYSIFCVGDTLPSLQCVIVTLIEAGEDFIVFLDDKMDLQWATNDSAKLEGDGHRLLSQVALLQTAYETHMEATRKSSQRKQFSEILAQVVANHLAGFGKEARDTLKAAEDLLITRSRETARKWYLCATTASSLTCLAAFLICWACRSRIGQVVGPNASELFTFSLLGGVSSIVFVARTARQVNINASEGRFIHLFEGFLRVLTGVLGAFVVQLLFISKIMFAPLLEKTSDHRSAIIAILCMSAGFSERYAPNLVKRIKLDQIGGPASEEDRHKGE